MSTTESTDEDFLDDPIQLNFEQKKFEQELLKNNLVNQPIDLTDSDGDFYIEKNNNVPEKNLPLHNSVSFTLPVNFFEIPRNLELLNGCKLLSIKVVNCQKYPWYHKKLLSNTSLTDDEVDFYNKECDKNCAMIEERKIKIRPVSSPYQNLKIDSSKSKVKSKKKENKFEGCDDSKHIKQKALDLRNCSNSEIDFKKNQGLIGMKITPTCEIKGDTTERKSNNKSNRKIANDTGETNKTPKTAVIVSKTPDTIDSLVDSAEVKLNTITVNKDKDKNDKSDRNYAKVSGKLYIGKKPIFQNAFENVVYNEAKVAEDLSNIPKVPAEKAASQKNNNLKIAFSEILENNKVPCKLANHDIDKSAAEKKKQEPVISYHARLSGLRLTVTKKGSISPICNSTDGAKTKDCPNTNNSHNSLEKSNSKKGDSKEKHNDSGKATSSVLTVTNPKRTNIVNKKLLKPKNNTSIASKPTDTLGQLFMCDKAHCKNSKQKIVNNLNFCNNQKKGAKSEYCNTVESLIDKTVKPSEKKVYGNECSNISQKLNYPLHQNVEQINKTKIPVQNTGEKLALAHDKRGIIRSYVDKHPRSISPRPPQNSNNNSLLLMNQQVNPQSSQTTKVSCINVMKNSVIIQNNNQNSNSTLNKPSTKTPSTSNKVNYSNNTKPVEKLHDKDINKTLELNVNMSTNPLQSKNQSCLKINKIIDKNVDVIPLNIPSNQKILPKSVTNTVTKYDFEPSKNSTNINNNVAGTILINDDETINQVQQKNQMQTYPIQTMVSTKVNMPTKQPLAPQKNHTYNSPMLSNFHAVRQILRQVPLQESVPSNQHTEPNVAQDIRQHPLVTQQPIQTLPSNAQTGSYLQEILPPTCDIAMQQTMPHNVASQIPLQGPESLNKSQQKMVFLNPRQIILRSIAPKQRQARQQINNTMIPRPGAPQHTFPPTFPPNNGMYVPRNNQFYGQRFQVHSGINGMCQHNYVQCPPIYKDFPKNINTMNQIPYWRNIHPPPPPPPPSQAPYFESFPQASSYQNSGSYTSVNNVSIPKSIAGTTVIGCNNGGPVKKINLLVPSEVNSKTSVDLTQLQPTTSDENNVSHKQQFCGQNINDDKTKLQPFYNNNGELSDSQIVKSKKEMLEELSKVTMIENSTSRKRLSTNTDSTFEESANLTGTIKRPRPGPLSSKLNFNATASPFQTCMQSRLQLSPVAHKGYSPPILPIPTYEKTLEMLARSKLVEPRFSHPTENETEMDFPSSSLVQNITKRRYTFDEKEDKSAKKISLDEYKKRVSQPDDKVDLQTDHIKKEIKCENEQDQGYSSDCTMRA